MSELSKAWYVRLSCSNCDEIRGILPAPPKFRMYCPFCQRPCEAVTLGTGSTTQTMPKWERHAMAPVPVEQARRMANKATRTRLDRNSGTGAFTEQGVSHAR